LNDISIKFVIALFQFVILLFSLSFHECAHAWMASRLGDQTARLQGRVTLNPIHHIDPIGTLLFPALMIFGPLLGMGGAGFLVGWAKPTPVITRNFKNIRRDDNLTTLAGPASNLILVILAFLLLVILMVAIPGGQDAVVSAANRELNPNGESAIQAIAMLLYLAVEVNVALMFFNLLPIPPLDGSHVVRNMLPYNALETYDQFGRFGFILIIVLGRYLVPIFMDPAITLVNSGLSLFLHQ
jgi:Zn-dependent protease